MRHSFNLLRIAERAAPKGSNVNTFYQRLNNVMKGAFNEMDDKELAKVEKVFDDAAKECKDHIKKLRNLRKKNQKEEENDPY